MLSFFGTAPGSVEDVGDALVVVVFNHVGQTGLRIPGGCRFPDPPPRYICKPGGRTSGQLLLSLLYVFCDMQREKGDMICLHIYK